MTRQEAARELGRVFAYLACNNIPAARHAAQQLMQWLETI